MPTFTKARVLWDAGDILTLSHIWGEIMATEVVERMVKELRNLTEEHAG